MASVSKVSIGSNTDDPIYECTICSIKFSYKKTLARHVRNKHSIGKLFQCEFCNSRFRDKSGLSSHIASIHTKKHHVVICPICHYEESKVMIHIHFEKVHNITLEEEKFNFTTLEEFEEWKMKIEKSTVARFVKTRMFKKKNGAQRITLNCHFFKSRGKNKRNIKSQGTNKIMGFCPARLEFEALDKEGIMVQFIKTHVGHANEEEKVLSQHEMRCLKRPQPVQKKTKYMKNDYLLSHYCQIVDEESVAGIGEMVGESTINNHNNITSFIRTQEVGEGDFIEFGEDGNSVEETATLNSASVINVNSNTTVDLNGDITGLDMSTVLSNGLDKEVQHGYLEGVDSPKPNSEPPGLLHVPATSVTMSSESVHLSAEKQLLIDHIKNLIEAVESRDLLWEVKKISQPTIETMKSLLVENLFKADEEVQDGDLEGLSDLEMTETSISDLDALDLNEFLTVQLEFQEKLQDDDKEENDVTSGDLDLDPFPDGVIGFDPFDSPKPNSEPPGLLHVQATSLTMSFESVHLSAERQLLIDQFQILIDAVKSRDLLWKMKKICQPAIETMKSLLVQNLFQGGVTSGDLDPYQNGDIGFEIAEI